MQPPPNQPPQQPPQYGAQPPQYSATPQGYGPRPMPGQPGVPGAPGPYAPYPQQYPPPQKKGISPLVIVIIVFVIVIGLFGVGGLLVGILAVAAVPKLAAAKAELELKQMGDLHQGLQQATVDNKNRKRLGGPELGNARGTEFWHEACKADVIESHLHKKLISLMGNQKPPSGIPQQSEISYTAPRGKDLLMVLNMKGQNRTIVFTWNSRNWRNAGGDKVPVVWSDGEMAEWLTFEDAKMQYGITRAEWDDPAGQLFGKKAPFKHTLE